MNFLLYQLSCVSTSPHVNDREQNRYNIKVIIIVMYINLYNSIFLLFYRYYFQTRPTITILNKGLIGVIKRYSWKKVGLITCRDSYYTVVSESIPSCLHDTWENSIHNYYADCRQFKEALNWIFYQLFWNTTAIWWERINWRPICEFMHKLLCAKYDITIAVIGSQWKEKHSHTFCIMLQRLHINQKPFSTFINQK